MPLKWIDSLGGPLIALPEAMAHAWRGNDAGSGDYDRACEVDGWLGVVDVDGADALVFGDEPALTCCVPVLDGVVIARWICAETDSDVEQLLSDIPADGFDSEELILRVKRVPLVVFDSVFSGDAAEDSLTIELPAGSYSASTRTWNPNDQTRLVLHRLSRCMMPTNQSMQQMGARVMPPA